MKTVLLLLAALLITNCYSQGLHSVPNFKSFSDENNIYWKDSTLKNQNKYWENGLKKMEYSEISDAKKIRKEYYSIDSFVVYICINGEFSIQWDENSEKVSTGETVLIPAMIKEIILEPSGEARLLEIFINSENNL